MPSDHAAHELEHVTNASLGGGANRDLRASTLDRSDPQVPLHDLAAALAGALTSADVVTAAVQHTAAALGAVGAVVALVPDDDPDSLELIAAADMPEEAFQEWHRFPLSAPAPLAHVARTGEEVFLESPDEWASRFPLVAEAARAAGHQANAVLPLRAAGRTLGALGIAFSTPRRFRADERALAATIAHQCALALERANLYERERAARARAEEITRELSRQADELEQAGRAKTQFLATMSHELRTPLNAIGGYADLLLMEIYGPLCDAQRDAIVRIQRSEQHLLGLINDVLNFARLDAGTVNFATNDVALRGTLEFVGDLIAPQIRSKRLGYNVDLPPASLMVRGESDKIRQVVLNLLSNAVKFTDANGTISIGCHEDAAAGCVDIFVRDTGCGIASNQLQHVFDPFVQLDRRLNHPTEGTGLGLAISRELARGMGGDLTVESLVGSGSTFTLRLPGASGRSRVTAHTAPTTDPA